MERVEYVPVKNKIPLARRPQSANIISKSSSMHDNIKESTTTSTTTTHNISNNSYRNQIVRRRPQSATVRSELNPPDDATAINTNIHSNAVTSFNNLVLKKRPTSASTYRDIKLEVQKLKINSSFQILSIYGPQGIGGDGGDNNGEGSSNSKYKLDGRGKILRKRGGGVGGKAAINTSFLNQINIQKERGMYIYIYNLLYLSSIVPSLTINI